MKDKYYKFGFVLVCVLLVIVCVFLFSAHKNKGFWKSETKRIEQEYKQLDIKIKAYQTKADSLSSIVEERNKEIQAKDSIISSIELDMTKIKKKYEKIYRTIGSFDAIGTYNFFTTYTDTTEQLGDCP